jgi:endonuclease V-like protein UPF0215 family
LKRDVRFLGIDDSPFTFDDDRVRIVGVVTRGPSYVEGVLSASVEVDGTDATARVAAMVTSTRFRPMLRAVLLNGITLGGFNVVDLDALHAGLGVPVVSIVRGEPDAAKAEAAVRKHFPDAQERLALLRRQPARPVRNGRFTVWANWRGIETEEIPALLAAATVRGAIPEPVRLAHIIASGIERGESRGPA